MNKEYFDVGQIVSIVYRPERVCTHFEWVESKPIKTFFGLITTGKLTEAGWFDGTEWDYTTYTDDEVRKKGYIVYSTDERINDRVCHMAYVKVYLTHDNTIAQSFESNQKAEEWIGLLKSRSGKKFEIATYE